MKTKILRAIALTFLTAASAAALAGTASAITYNLRADRVNLTMSDGTVVPAWGFADDTAGAGTGAVTVPGPQLIVPSGDTTLVINLQNNLPVPVSISIPGQPYPAAASPTNLGGRVLSFTNQVAAGGAGTITFNNVRPGTFRYESGTNPAMEVPMGLYGALIVRPAAAGQAYNGAGSAYDNEQVVLLSEIDPVFNGYVDANGSTVDAVNGINYSIGFAPKYFLVNGTSFPQTADLSAPAGQRTLLRMINAGSRNYVPTLQGIPFTVIAEDGYLLNFPRHEVSVSMAAGKTLDLMTAPTATGYHALYERRTGRGMLTFIGDLNCNPAKGDVTGDSRITAADALTVLNAYVNGTTGSLPMTAYGPAADVSLESVSGLPCGDGAIDLSDVLLLLRKAVGLDGY